MSAAILLTKSDMADLIGCLSSASALSIFLDALLHLFPRKKDQRVAVKALQGVRQLSECNHSRTFNLIGDPENPVNRNAQPGGLFSKFAVTGQEHGVFGRLRECEAKAIVRGQAWELTFQSYRLLHLGRVEIDDLQSALFESGPVASGEIVQLRADQREGDHELKRQKQSCC